MKSEVPKVSKIQKLVSFKLDYGDENHIIGLIDSSMFILSFECLQAYTVHVAFMSSWKGSRFYCYDLQRQCFQVVVPTLQDHEPTV